MILTRVSISLIDPVTLLTAWINIIRVLLLIFFSRVLGEIKPLGAFNFIILKPFSIKILSKLITLACSVLLIITSPGFLLHNSDDKIILLDSVPPEVKYRVAGLTPNRDAISSLVFF